MYPPIEYYNFSFLQNQRVKQDYKKAKENFEQAIELCIKKAKE